MKAAARVSGFVVLLVASFGSIGAASTNHRQESDRVDKIRITDAGPFRVWNGVDGDADDPEARVLAVIGATKSLRVNYRSTMAPPQVRVGSGWADVVAGTGTSMTFAGPKSDCYRNTILWCTDGPFGNLPPGTIVCMCTLQNSSICCTSDTGIFPDMVPIGDGEI